MPPPAAIAPAAIASSPVGSATRQALEREIARIEGRAPRLDGPAYPDTRLGSSELDAALGGGLDRAGLHEVTPAEASDSGAAFGFALALAARLTGEIGHAVLVTEAAAERECGLPYGPGLAAHGLDPARLVLVRVERAVDALWALEEALRGGAPALAMALLAGRPSLYDLTVSRRLALAARARRLPALLVFAGQSGLAANMASAAATRWEIAAAPSPTGLAAEPQQALWRVRLTRNRRGQTDERHLDWNHDERHFDDVTPLRGGSSAILADGARAPPTERRLVHRVG